MSNQYIFAISGGGQKIQEETQRGNPIYYETLHPSEIMRNPGIASSNAFADTIWAEELSKLQELADEWAGQKVDLLDKSFKQTPTTQDRPQPARDLTQPHRRTRHEYI